MNELQEKIGINKGVISKLENGETKRPELKTMFTISDALHIPLHEVIYRYVEVEKRPTMLHEVLVKSIKLGNNMDLIKTVTLAYLSSDRHETEDALATLYEFTSTIHTQEIQLVLYNSITEYARLRGIPPFIAKGLLQIYFITRLDLHTKEKTFDKAKEILYYIDFLSHAEKILFYFRMTLHAYGIKKYEQSIAFCKKGLLLETEDTELRAKAHGTLINAYFELQEYEEVEKHLNQFEHYKHDFIHECALYTRAIVKVKKKEYEIAIPLLEKTLNEISKPQRLYVANELLTIYTELHHQEAMQKLFSKEEAILSFLEHPEATNEQLNIGMYYEFKGNFQMNQGQIDEAMSSYTKSMETYEKINATEEMNALQYKIILQTLCINR